MHKKIKILILVISIFVFGLWARDFFIKSLIGTISSRILGAPVHIGGLSLGLIKQSVKIVNFKIYNPPGFPKEVFVNIPNMAVAWDLKAFLKGRLYLKSIDFALKEVVLMKNKEGKLNVDSLKIAQEKTTPAEKEKSAKPKKEMAIQIDQANLAIGRIVNKDYSLQGQPAIKVYEVNLNKSYKNITSIEQFALLIISEPLKAAGIQGLKVYGVSLLTGVAALPVAAAFTFTGKDYARASFKASWDAVYKTAVQTLNQMGKIKKENKADGIINAEVNGASVTLKLKKIDDSTTEALVSARKFGLPKPEVASGVIYQLSNKLK